MQKPAVGRIVLIQVGQGSEDVRPLLITEVFSDTLIAGFVVPGGKEAYQPGAQVSQIGELGTMRVVGGFASSVPRGFDFGRWRFHDDQGQPEEQPFPVEARR